MGRNDFQNWEVKPFVCQRNKCCNFQSHLKLEYSVHGWNEKGDKFEWMIGEFGSKSLQLCSMIPLKWLS
jgi:hypothetical protein